LVYAAGLDAHRAAGTSLVIVGLVARGGGLARWRYIAVRTALVFAPLGMLATWPGVWLNHRVPGAIVLLGLAVTMLLVAARTIRVASSISNRGPRRAGVLALVLTSLTVGLLTGFFGVGGGFLIVPALSLVMRLPMVEAVATSLLVIALNCAAGLLGHVWYGTIAWSLGASMTASALLGAVLTLPLARRLGSAALARAFAGLLVVVGGGMLVESLREVFA
jgi:hypothetical protein